MLGYTLKLKQYVPLLKLLKSRSDCFKPNKYNAAGYIRTRCSIKSKDHIQIITENAATNRLHNKASIPIQDLNTPTSFMNLLSAMGSYVVYYRNLVSMMPSLETNSVHSLMAVLRQAKSVRCPGNDTIFTYKERLKNNMMLQSYLPPHGKTSKIMFMLNRTVSAPIVSYSDELFLQKQCHFHTCARYKTAVQSSNQTNLSADVNQQSDQPQKDRTKDHPSRHQLQQAVPRLENLVIKMFTGRHDYGILHRNVVMENNLFGAEKRCMGVSAYALELMKLRFQVHFRFPSAVVEVRNVIILEQSSTIRIHWRLKGVPQTQVLKVWRLFQQRDTVDKDEWKWMDAFSYFDVGKDGLVHKHRIDRIIPDIEEEEGKLTEKLKNLVPTPKPAVG